MDPLLTNNPNVTPSLEIKIYRENPIPNYLSNKSSPRLFPTHVPYRELFELIKNSKCRILYIMSRSPKGTFVSMWHLLKTIRSDGEWPFPIEEAFESFCDGVNAFGPFCDQVLEYWKVNLEKPEKILFLNDPKGQVKTLSEFLERPFDKEEEDDKVVCGSCGLERLKGLDVNRGGPTTLIFRLGTVGDWKNHLMIKMAARPHEITHMKLQGSGLI